MTERPEFPFERRNRERLIFEVNAREKERADQDRQAAQAERDAERKNRQQEIAASTSLIETAKRLNLITALTALFALFSAIGVIWSVIDAEKATVEANRAWVASLEPVWQMAPLKAGDKYQIELMYENVGKEPALDVTAIREETTFKTTPLADITDMHSVLFTPNVTCSKPDFNDKAGKSGTLWPTRTDAPYYLFDSKPPRELGQNITNGSEVLGFRGCIRYRTFGKEHKTAFCFFLNQRIAMAVKDWVWAPCPEEGENFAD